MRWAINPIIPKIKHKVTITYENEKVVLQFMFMRTANYAVICMRYITHNWLDYISVSQPRLSLNCLSFLIITPSIMDSIDAPSIDAVFCFADAVGAGFEYTKFEFFFITIPPNKWIEVIFYTFPT